MLLDGKEFQIYITDSLQSAIDRIAVRLNSHPDYLIFTPPVETLDDLEHDVKVRNVLVEIRESTDIQMPTVPIPPKLTLEQLEKIFVASNKLLEDNVRNRNVFLLAMKGMTIDPERTWRDRQDILETLKKSIKKLTRKVEAEELTARELTNITPVEYTEFNINHTQFTVKLGSTTKTLPEIFNEIVLTHKVPYAAMATSSSTLFKIHKNFVPNVIWLDLIGKEVIIVKVNGEKNGDLRELKNPFKKYTNAIFGIVDGQLVCTMTMNVGKRNIERDVFIKRSLKIFPYNNLHQQVQSIEENNVVGYYIYPDETLQVSVWAELTMNDKMFSSLLAIDESLRASKIKQNVYLHLIDTDETISLQMKYIERPGQFPEKDLDVGTPYVRARVAKTKSVARAKKLQEIIGKLLVVYKLNYKDVVSFYHKFIPDFAKDTGKKVPRKPLRQLGLRDIAPDIFFPTYSRKCLNRPTIISTQEATTTTKKVMKFPIRGESTERNYICDQTKHPFPGLRDNQLENKEQFPYVPCCYSKDQEIRPGSKYRQYFFGEHRQQKVQQIQEIFITNKIVPPGVIGVLPKCIREMFGIIEKDPEYSFVRKGVTRGKLSSIETILLGKGIISGDEPDLDKILIREQNKLATEAYALSTKQELYDEDVSSIISMIRNDDLRITCFVHMLEQAYNCSIFVFTADTPDGELCIPRHVQAYYKFEPTKETFFVFQHMGSESDHAEYPQCELIVKAHVDDTRRQITGFVPSDPVVKNLYDIFHRLNRTYIFGDIYPKLKLKTLPIIGQALDSYGKCRLLNLKNNLTIIVDPLPPFAVNQVVNIYRVKLLEVEKFAHDYGTNIIFQRINQKGMVTEVRVELSRSVFGTILTLDSGRIKDVGINNQEEEYSQIIDKAPSAVTYFNTNRRLAKLIYQYALFITSEYMSANNLNFMKSEDFDKMAQQFFMVDPNATYDLSMVKSVFTPQTPLISNGKLVVQSTEALRRLIFMIRLFQDHKKQELVQYHTKLNIPDFYGDIADYDTSPLQYVLQGTGAVINLIEGSETKYSLTNKVKSETKLPYFFQNDLIGLDIYVAENTTSVGKAGEIINFWNLHGYNIGDPEVDVDVNIKPKIYSYVNESNMYEIKPGKGPGAILAYKINGVPMYTALMRL